MFKLCFIDNILGNLKKDKNFSNILKGGSVTFISKIVTVIATLLFNFIVARNYGASATGILSFSINFVKIVSIFVLFGLNISILKYIPEHRTKYSEKSARKIYWKSFKIVTVTSIVVFFIILIFSENLASLFDKPHFNTYILISGFFILPNALYLYHTAVMKAYKRINSYALIEIGSHSFKVILLLLITLFYINQKVPVIAFYLGPAVGVCLFLYNLKDKIFKIENEISKKIKEVPGKNILLFSLPMFFIAISHTVNNSASIMVLSYYESDANIGILHIAHRLTALIPFMLIAINSVAAPKFSELYAKGDIKALSKLSKQATLVVFIFSLVVSSIYFVFGKEILNLFGEEFVSGYLALIIISIGKLINASTGSVGWLLNMTDSQKHYAGIVIFTTLLNISLNFYLIPIYGILGAAIAISISEILNNLLAFILVKLKLGFWNFFILK